MAILTDATWLQPTPVLQAIEGGARTGLAAAGQQQDAQSAAQRLKYSYDALAAQQENERQKRASQQQQINAAAQFRKSQQDALTEWRKSQVKNQQDRLAETVDKAKAAAEMLKTEHDDTAAFVEDAQTMGAADAYSKHPNADKTVVNQVMALEQAKEKTPPQKGALDFAAPGQTAENASALTRFTGVQLNDPVINKVLGTNAPPGTGTNYVSAADRLKAAPQVAPALDPIVPKDQPVQINPLPKSKGDLQAGKVYQTAKGPATWDGEKFTPAQ